jgi:hypothetical protein
VLRPYHTTHIRARIDACQKLNYLRPLQSLFVADQIRRILALASIPASLLTLASLGKLSIPALSIVFALCRQEQLLTTEWSLQRRKTDKIIRCPYCVEDRTFKAMLRHSSGNWFVCDACGHLTFPADPLFNCTCRKCVCLKTMQKNFNPKSIV